MKLVFSKYIALQKTDINNKHCMIFLSVGFSTLDFLWNFKHKNFVFVHFEQSLFASNILCLLRTFLWSFKLSKCCIFLLQAFFCSLQTFFIHPEQSVFPSNILRSLRTFFICFEHSYKVSNFQNVVCCEHFLLAANIFYSLRIFFVRYDHFMFPVNIILFDSNI